MNNYQRKLAEEQRAKQERENVSEESLRAAQLAKAEYLMTNPGDEKFASIAISIQMSAFRGRLDAVEWFINSKKVHPDEIDNKGYAAIHYAAEKGHDNCVASLLKYKGFVDIRSFGGMTPLMSACKGGFPHIVRQLYEAGASLLSQDNSGMTAAHYAAQEDHDTCIQMLYTLAEEEKAKIEKAYIEDILRNGRKKSVAPKPITDESSFLSVPNVEEMKQDEAFTPLKVLQVPSKNGLRPLHVAAGFDSRKVIALLIQYKVDINPLDNVEETPLHKSARRNFNLSYNMLKEGGANDRLRNSMRETPADVLIDNSY